MDTATEFKNKVEEGMESMQGPPTQMMESATSKIPSRYYLLGAFSSMAVSATLQLMGKQKLSLFIGQWAPSFLLLGIYNKISHLTGTD